MTGKFFTPWIERQSLTLRIRLNRLVRKTICFACSGFLLLLSFTVLASDKTFHFKITDLSNHQKELITKIEIDSYGRSTVTSHNPGHPTRYSLFSQASADGIEPWANDGDSTDGASVSRFILPPEDSDDNKGATANYLEKDVVFFTPEELEAMISSGHNNKILYLYGFPITRLSDNRQALPIIVSAELMTRTDTDTLYQVEQVVFDPVTRANSTITATLTLTTSDKGKSVVQSLQVKGITVEIYYPAGTDTTDNRGRQTAPSPDPDVRSQLVCCTDNQQS